MVYILFFLSFLSSNSFSFLFSSLILIGFWATFGAKDDLNDQQGIDVAKACLRVARDAGVNLFDNAEAYGNPNGEAERIMGVALKQLQEEDPVKWRRSELVITTKVYYFIYLFTLLILFIYSNVIYLFYLFMIITHN